MILLSHPTAAGHARHTALALSRAGVLAEFWACAVNGNVARPCQVTLPQWPTAPANGHTPLDGLFRSLDQTVSARLACEDFKGVYAFEDGADESFRIAGLRGMLRIYDVATAHWQTELDLCAEEAALEPEWSATLGPSAQSPASAARRDSELQQADLVMAPSTFVMQTLEQVPALPATVALLPRGVVTSRHDPATTFPAAPGKLRVLYIGPLTQRKGISYLFRACRELSSIATLTIIGPPPDDACPALARELGHVRWRPTCPAEALPAEMAAHDVLVAPSLLDGFDPVLLEALGAGLPLIATPHTAAGDLIDHGFEGFIVPIRSPEEIAAKLELLWREPERRSAMSLNARRRAGAHTWENYERALAASVATALSRR